MARIDPAKVAGTTHVPLFSQIELNQITRIKVDTVVEALLPTRIIREITVILAPDHGLVFTGIRPQYNAKHLILHDTPVADPWFNVNETLATRQIIFRVGLLQFVARIG